MIVLGERAGFSFWRYDPACMDKTWSLHIGFGGKVPNRPEGVFSTMYRYEFSAAWRPLATCFHWWREELGLERGRGVVVQYRIHSFRRWPVSIRFDRWRGHEDSVGESAAMRELPAPDRGAETTRPSRRFSAASRPRPLPAVLESRTRPQSSKEFE